MVAVHNGGWLMTMTTQEVVHGFWESYNDHDLEKSFETYISPKLVNHAFGGAYDREAWLGVEKGFVDAFKDLHAEIVKQVTEGDTSSTYVLFSGTQSKDYYGVPSVGNKATLHAVFFDRVEDDRIVEHWAEADVNGFLQELAGTASTLEL
jgi:predicted ester cyclase